MVRIGKALIVFVYIALAISFLIEYLTIAANADWATGCIMFWGLVAVVVFAICYNIVGNETSK